MRTSSRTLFAEIQGGIQRRQAPMVIPDRASEQIHHGAGNGKRSHGTNFPVQRFPDQPAGYSTSRRGNEFHVYARPYQAPESPKGSRSSMTDHRTPLSPWCLSPLSLPWRCMDRELGNEHTMAGGGIIPGCVITTHRRIILRLEVSPLARPQGFTKSAPQRRVNSQAV